MKRLSRLAFGLFVLALLGISALLLGLPRSRAALRLTPGFSPLTLDHRIWLESGAERQAEQLARALPAVVARIERAHGRSFSKSFRVYLCSSHRSFTEHLGLPRDSQVRGVAFPWHVWISPKAFDFHRQDTHVESLSHELAHLYVVQHLGWIRRTRNLPTWFQEGLADWVADTGFEVVSRRRAQTLIARGRHLRPDGSGHLPTPRPLTSYGVSPPVLHAQARLFVEHLAGEEPEAFAELLAALLSGEPFAQAFEASFAKSYSRHWDDFVAGTRSSSIAAGPTTEMP